MTMIKHHDSHLDHNLTAAQVAHVLAHFADRSAFFCETFEIPRELGGVPCGLYGPLLGDPPVGDAEVTLACRGTRTWTSRLVARPMRSFQTVVVIGGPHDGHPCILYTIYGGPLAPQEPGDPGCKDPAASAAFWRDHALALG